MLARTLGQARASLERIFKPLTRWDNPAPPKPPADAMGLKVVSYNILLGGRYLDRVEADLRRMAPDVACLQEASEPAARQLAEKLGMHMVISDGKAILSRYPFEDVQHVSYETPLTERVAAYVRNLRKTRKLHHLEPFYQRGVLHATVRVGDRTVSLLDTHLSLNNPNANTQQLLKLTELSRGLEAQGHTVIAAGDFNTNFALAQAGAADAAGKFDSATDTMSEFRARYGGGPGNIATAANRAAAEQLLGRLESYWAAPERTVRTNAGDISPEQARAELASGTVTPGSERYQTLLRVMDGISHHGARKRFDNIFASRDVVFTSAHQDHVTRGSDHQPVMATVSFR